MEKVDEKVEKAHDYAQQAKAGAMSAPGKPASTEMSPHEKYLFAMRREADFYRDCAEPGKPPWHDDRRLARSCASFTGYVDSTPVPTWTYEQKLKRWRFLQRRAQDKRRKALAESGSEHLAEAGLVLYDKMRQAIEQCENVDEVKEVRSKATALALYRRQAGDREAEKKFAAIRLRAERRIGELLGEMKQTGQRAKAGDRGPSDGRGARPSVETKTLSDLKITKDESSKFQQLAAIPRDKFEEAIARTEQVPTTAGVISASKTAPRVNAKIKPADDGALDMGERVVPVSGLIRVLAGLDEANAMLLKILKSAAVTSPGLLAEARACATATCAVAKEVRSRYDIDDPDMLAMH